MDLEENEKCLKKKRATSFKAKYTQETLAACLKDIKEKHLSMNAASRKYGIPKSTVYSKLIGSRPAGVVKPGPTAYLGNELEKQLVYWILDCEKHGFSFDLLELKYSVSELIKELPAEKKKVFREDFQPSRSWLNAFFARHPEITPKKRELHKKSSKEVVTKSSVTRWFEHISNILDGEIFQDPTRIFTIDETTFYANNNNEFVLSERDRLTYKNSKSVSDREFVTVLFSVNAKSDITPPMVVYKYETIKVECSSAVPFGWYMQYSENGGVTSNVFYTYFVQIFNPYLEEKRIKKPVVVFMDGWVSHISFSLSQFCWREEIRLVCTPPLTAHLLLPLDEAYFKNLKNFWSIASRKFHTEKKKNIGKYDIPFVLQRIVTANDFPIVVQMAFKDCGLYPFNPSAVDYAQILPEITSSPSKSDDTSASSPTDFDKTEMIIFMQLLEKRIEPEILQEFRDNPDFSNWKGKVEYTALFNLWSKHKLDYINFL